jgi:hypothetical protein
VESLFTTAAGTDTIQVLGTTLDPAVYPNGTSLCIVSWECDGAYHQELSRAAHLVELAPPDPTSRLQAGQEVTLSRAFLGLAATSPEALRQAMTATQPAPLRIPPSTLGAYGFMNPSFSTSLAQQVASMIASARKAIVLCNFNVMLGETPTEMVHLKIIRDDHPPSSSVLSQYGNWDEYLTYGQFVEPTIPTHPAPPT